MGVARLDEEAYGVTVSEEIRQVTGRDATIPAVYVTLSRLEKKGLVTSRSGDATPERAGRAKKYYRLTDDGTAALRASQAMLARLFQGVRLGTAPSKGI